MKIHVYPLRVTRDIRFNFMNIPLVMGLLVTILILTSGCASSKKDKSIQVFSAASLTEVMTAMADSFKLYHQQKVVLNFASTGTLSRQIEMGAGAHIFISANKQWMDYLVSEKVIGEGGFEEVAGNSLVLISGNSMNLSLSLSEAIDKRFVIGDPATVPVGSYTKHALDNLGLWEDDHGFLFGRDVKQVLMLVEMGEAECGIVYKTDAIDNPKVQILQEVPASMYPQVKYYICDLRPQELSGGDEFLRFVKSDKGKAIWKKFGFKYSY